MVVQHSLLAMNAERMLNINTKDRAKSAEKLASGYRINRAADDAAGLAISEKMRRQIRGLSQAALNTQDGISLVQSAEGALNEIHEMLQRMNELCVKGANDTLTYEDRQYIQEEINALQDEIDRTGSTTSFNEIKILNGVRQETITAEYPDHSFAGISGSLTQATSGSLATYSVSPLQDGDILSMTGDEGTVYYAVNGSGASGTPDGTYDHPYTISKESVYRHISNELLKANVAQTGAVAVQYSGSGDDEGVFTMQFLGSLKLNLQVGSETDDSLGLEINTMNCSALQLWDVNVEGYDGRGARAGIECVKKAIEINSGERAKLGAYQNRLDHIIKNLGNVIENTKDAESLIRDTEMAGMASNNANRDLLIQAGQMVLAQANDPMNLNMLSTTSDFSADGEDAKAIYLGLKATNDVERALSGTAITPDAILLSGESQYTSTWDDTNKKYVWAAPDTAKFSDFTFTITGAINNTLPNSTWASISGDVGSTRTIALKNPPKVSLKIKLTPVVDALPLTIKWTTDSSKNDVLQVGMTNAEAGKGGFAADALPTAIVVNGRTVDTDDVTVDANGFLLIPLEKIYANYKTDWGTAVAKDKTAIKALIKNVKTTFSSGVYYGQF